MPMFRNAAAKFGEHEAVQWLKADACSLPFGDRMFDASRRAASVLRFVVQNIDTGNGSDENVPANSTRTERGKLFDRKLFLRHKIG